MWEGGHFNCGTAFRFPWSFCWLSTMLTIVIDQIHTCSSSGFFFPQWGSKVVFVFLTVVAEHSREGQQPDAHWETYIWGTTFFYPLCVSVLWHKQVKVETCCISCWQQFGAPDVLCSEKTSPCSINLFRSILNELFCSVLIVFVLLLSSITGHRQGMKRRMRRMMRTRKTVRKTLKMKRTCRIWMRWMITTSHLMMARSMRCLETIFPDQHKIVKYGDTRIWRPLCCAPRHPPLCLPVSCLSQLSYPEQLLNTLNAVFYLSLQTVKCTVFNLAVFLSLRWTWREQTKTKTSGWFKTKDSFSCHQAVWLWIPAPHSILDCCLFSLWQINVFICCERV